MVDFLAEDRAICKASWRTYRPVSEEVKKKRKDERLGTDTKYGMSFKKFPNKIGHLRNVHGHKTVQFVNTKAGII